MPSFKEYFKWKYMREPWRAVAILQWKFIELFGFGIHYAEQVVWRMHRCPECVLNNSCKYCPCNVFGMMVSPWGRCSNHRWGKMMSKKKWNEYKIKNGVEFAAFDYGLFLEEGSPDDVIALKTHIDELRELKSNTENDLEELKQLAGNLQSDYNELIELYEEKKKVYDSWLNSKIEYEKSVTTNLFKMEMEMNPENIKEEIIEIDMSGSVESNVKEDILNNEDMSYLNINGSNDWIRKRLLEQMNVPEVIDLGVLKRGEEKLFSFEYKGNLTIVKTHGSCTCTVQETVGNKISGKIKKSLKSETGDSQSSVSLELKPEDGKEYYYKTIKGNIFPEKRNFIVQTTLKYKIV